VQDSNSIVHFPAPSATTLVLIGLALTFMAIAAIAIAYYQRNETRRRRIGAEWRSALEIMKEREMTEDEIELVEDIIRRHLPDYPLRVVTVRHEFDECTRREMERLDGEPGGDTYREMGERLRDIRLQLGLDYIPFGQKIDSTRELYSGQWISVSHAKSATPKWTRMRVDRVDEAYFYVSSHPKQGEPSPVFHEGDIVRCRLWRDEDARYSFETQVAGHDDAPPGWRFEHSGGLNRVQARDHYRVRHDQPSNVGLLNAALDGDDSDLANRRTVTKLRGRVTSLSAGGCALVVPQEVSRQVVLRIELELGGDEPMNVHARIVATSGISGGRVLVRAEFIGLDDGERDRIAKFVHRKQQHIIAAREATR
jgi:c-di-GMP-binding flagellar brake protein YcgR